MNLQMPAPTNPGTLRLETMSTSSGNGDCFDADVGASKCRNRAAALASPSKELAKTLQELETLRSSFGETAK